MRIVEIPTLNDNLSDFDKLFKILQLVKQDGSSIKLDFTPCKFLRQNAVAFLGGAIRLIESQGGKVDINRKTLLPQVEENLVKNSFLKTFSGEKQLCGQGNTIPFREDQEWENAKMVDFLKDKWLGRGWLHISDKLRDIIVSKVAEIYLNSFEHSHSQIGVFSCGQHYPSLNELVLTVIDFGVGIPKNVNSYFLRKDIKSSKALEWSFKSGCTTNPKNFGRGLGLDILKNFVKANEGSLEVFSLDGFVKISQNEDIFEDRDSFFQGTLINIKLKCDENRYILAGESGPNFST